MADTLSVSPMSEEQVEDLLVSDLVSNGYQFVHLPDEEHLLNNFREQFTLHNQHLFRTTPLSDGEWSQILTGLNKSRSVYDRTIYVNEPQTLTRDDGSVVHYTFVNPDSVVGNKFQVTRQVTMRNGYEIRYDVILLINGIPFVVIELKKPGKALRDAHGQVNRYHRQASSLFRYTRLWIISNFINTRYFAANTNLPDLSATFTWADVDNKHINKLQHFTETFLTPTHISKMLFRYTVLHNTQQSLMAMRPYQVYAAEAIVTQVEKHTNSTPTTTPHPHPTEPPTTPAEGLSFSPNQPHPSRTPTPLTPPHTPTNLPLAGVVAGKSYTHSGGGTKNSIPSLLPTSGGYIWHTTGSGKTLTSFKTAQLLIKNPNVGKVVFVVDRNDLDYQTQREFNNFHPGSVDGTDNTRHLVQQLTDPNVKLVITTIQKLNNAVKHPTKKLRTIADSELFVFLFDECHRSQFGDAHQRINDFFPHKFLFGFTGTPIFAANHIQKRTTQDIFGPKLHSYIIKDGISDGSVLPFAVEYVGVDTQTETGKETTKGIRTETGAETAQPHNLNSPTHPNTPTAHTGTPQWIEEVDKFIIRHHHTKTFYNHKTKNFTFQAILATHNIPDAIAHYDNLWTAYRAGESVIKPAVIYTYDPNGDYTYAPQLEDTPNSSQPSPLPLTTQDMKSARDKLQEAITNFNLMFDTNHTLHDNGFAQYYQDVSKKLREGQLHLLIVVNMFLTGYDNPTLNTLYVDKELKYHSLIQAFSRTNRVLFNKEGGHDAPTKPYGNIVTFRNLKHNIDEAISLYADPDASTTIIRTPYPQLKETLQKRTLKLLNFTPTPDHVDQLNSEDAQAQFAELFRNLLAVHNEITTYTAYTHDTTLTPDTVLPADTFLAYKSKYVDLRDIAQKIKKNDPDTESPLTEFDFDLVSLRSETINVDYILKLLRTLHRDATHAQTVPADHTQTTLDETNTDNPDSTSQPPPSVNIMDTPELKTQLDRLKTIINTLSDTHPQKEWLQRYVEEEVFPAHKPLPPLKEFHDYLAETKETKLQELAHKLKLPHNTLTNAYTRYIYDNTLNTPNLLKQAHPKPTTVREKRDWRKRLESWFTYMKDTFEE